jgi:hypothetical protein
MYPQLVKHERQVVSSDGCLLLLSLLQICLVYFGYLFSTLANAGDTESSPTGELFVGQARDGIKYDL